MKILRLVLRPALVAAACAAISACANNPPRQTALNYQTRSVPTAQGANSALGSPSQRLTIKAGEGEDLYLPWFIRDAQEWVNRR
jgi:hypothetical protein